MDEKITFDDDGIILRIEGYKEYKIKENDNDDEDCDYTILSGRIEDTARYIVKINDDKQLHIVYEENDLYDFDDNPIACQMEKISD